MDEAALLRCIEWVAHGFEIVDSSFPDWRFKAPDVIAAGVFHRALLLGKPQPVNAGNLAASQQALGAFTLTLRRDGTEVETGRATNVLDGPLLALRHLVELLPQDKSNPPLRAGEIVTTGTVTGAYPIRPGETWSTSLSAIQLDGISVKFG
jgi:2-oxo-3-hexenedioate decarboxylase